MEVKIVDKKIIKVAGISIMIKDISEFPGLWERLYKEFDINYLKSLGTGQSFGLCFELDDGLKYFAGYETTSDTLGKGLEEVIMEEGEYGVIDIKGKLPDSLHKGIKFLNEEFLPSSSYKRKIPLNIEVYFEGDINGDNYEMELWAPLEKEVK